MLRVEEELFAYEGFCEECKCQTKVSHSAYLGAEVCPDCKKKLLEQKNILVKIKKG